VALSIEELKKRIKGTQGKFDLLQLRDDLEAFIRDPQFMELAENERDQVLDLLADVFNKVDGHRGCDPLRIILGR
jgi:hypothetical protein